MFHLIFRFIENHSLSVSSPKDGRRLFLISFSMPDNPILSLAIPRFLPLCNYKIRLLRGILIQVVEVIPHAFPDKLFRVVF